MSRIIEISDLSAPEIAAYAGLTERQLRSKQIPERGIFIAEGTKVIGHALNAGYEPVSFLMERKHIEGKAAELISRAGDADVYTGPDALLAKLTGFELTRGVLCAMRRPVSPQPEEICANAGRIAVLEGIVDPTNAGAIFRSAAALGMDAILLTPTCCDVLNRRCVRVSMGTVFQVPWARIGSDHSEWPHPGIERIRRMGFSTAAMALEHDSVPIDDPVLRNAEKLAVILGAEGDGLTPATVQGCDHTVLIPMSNGVDSLNVAAAAAIAFWQLGKR